MLVSGCSNLGSVRGVCDRPRVRLTCQADLLEEVVVLPRLQVSGPPLRVAVQLVAALVGVVDHQSRTIGASLEPESDPDSDLDLSLLPD